MKFKFYCNVVTGSFVLWPAGRGERAEHPWETLNYSGRNTMGAAVIIRIIPASWEIGGEWSGVTVGHQSLS